MAGEQCRMAMARAYAVGLYTEDKQPVRNQIPFFAIHDLDTAKEQYYLSGSLFFIVLVDREQAI